MTCMSNLKQCGLASALYTTDNSDSLTWPNWDGASDPPGWLYNHANGVVPNPQQCTVE